MVEVIDRDGNELLLTIIITPMSSTSWKCHDISLANAVDLLVLVTSAALAPLFPWLSASLEGLGLRLESLSTARVSNANQSLAPLNVNQARHGMEIRQGKRIAADDTPHGSNSSTLELLLVLVPQLSDAAL